MSKEHLEQFVKQVADSEVLQAKIGMEITGDALVALGAAHGCDFSIEDVQASAELSDAQMEGVAGGLMQTNRKSQISRKVTVDLPIFGTSGGGRIRVIINKGEQMNHEICEHISYQENSE